MFAAVSPPRWNEPRDRCSLCPGQGPWHPRGCHPTAVGPQKHLVTGTAGRRCQGLVTQGRFGARIGSLDCGPARLRALLGAAHCRIESGVSAAACEAAAPRRPPPPLPCRRRRRLCRRLLGTGCMIRPQSSMSRHIPFCGVLGHTFMEFLKGSGDYCQAQHDLYADK
ncbi:protein tyrosine phosphatase type IVA 1 isoform X3 [Camelus ferus]|nr:protein tyrosine phosphatase type IVA 1 isoform X3 [Camelus ferus]